MIRHNR